MLQGASSSFGRLAGQCGKRPRAHCGGSRKQWIPFPLETVCGQYGSCGYSWRAGYDLPLAVGILATDEKVKPDKLSRTMMLGELSLDGSLQPVKGGFADSHKAREMGFEYLIVPRQNVREAAVVNRLKVYGASHIGEVVRFLNDEGGLIPTEIDTRAEFMPNRQSLISTLRM